MARTASDAEDLAALCRQTLAQDGPAVRFEGHWTSWAQIRAVATEVAAALDAAGVPPGAPVAFAPRNSPASLAAFLPLLAQQRRVRMLYPFQSPAALAACIAECDVAALVMERVDFTPDVLRALAAAGIAGIALDPSGAAPVGTRGLAQSRTPRSPALEILTSGTTGPPKPFAIGYDVVLGYVRQAEALGGARTGPAAPPLLCFPLSNISGLYSLAMSFLRGERVILLERFSVAAWRDYVVEFRPPAGGGPPAALAMILEAQIPREDLASLSSFSTGAAPVDPDVRARFEGAYGIPVLQTYGATEFGGPVTALSLDLLRTYGADKGASVGRPFGGAKIRIRREEDGALATAGEVGRVEVISPRMGTDWIVTSDLGALDGDGFLTLFGRADGAIQRGGFKIVPERLEQVLLAHPEVAEVAVVGVPDARLHEVPGALIVPRDPGCPPEAWVLEAHVRAHLPATHVPARWRFADALPRTVSFKTDRGAVRALLEGGAVSPDR